ncbi:MAG: hypothetical protein WCC64_18070 [Aliidongia sp.]
MRKITLLVALAGVIGLGAYFGLSSLSNKGVKQMLDQALQKLPPGWTVTYSSADYGVWSNRAVLKGIEIHGTGTVTVDATIDELDVGGLSLDLGSAWSRATADPATRTPDKALPVADSIAIKGVVARLEGQEIRLGFARIDRMRLYPWALLHDNVPSFGEAMSLIQHPSTPPKPEDVLPLLRFEAAYVQGVGYDSYMADDLAARFQVPMPDAPPMSVVYTVRKLSATDVDHGANRDFAIDGLAATAGPNLDLKIEHVGASGLDARKLLTSVLSGAPLDAAGAEAALGKLDSTGIAVKTQTGAPVTIGAITLSNLAIAQGLPVSANFSVTGFKVAKAQVTDPSALDVFNQWGLDSVTLGFGVDYSWNAEQKSALLKQADIKIDELGDLTLSADFSGIEKAETVMQTGALKHAVLRYTDASLVGRTLKIVAGGGDPVEYARELALAIQAQSAIFGNTEAVAAAAKAIGAFLVDPHHLTIEASPPQPLTLAAFDAVRRSPPSEIFPKLGLAVTVGP